MIKTMNFRVAGDANKQINVKISKRVQQIFDKIFKFQTFEAAHDYLYMNIIKCMPVYYRSFKACKKDYEESFDEIINSLALYKMAELCSQQQTTADELNDMNSLLTSWHVYPWKKMKRTKKLVDKKLSPV